MAAWLAGGYNLEIRAWQGWCSINSVLSVEHQAENKVEVRVGGTSEFLMGLRERGLGLGNIPFSGQNS